MKHEDPQEVRDAAEVAVLNLLPRKSRKLHNHGIRDLESCAVRRKSKLTLGMQC